jgi:pimeloyl-ACP methyl ester carboxylesterase
MKQLSLSRRRMLAAAGIIPVMGAIPRAFAAEPEAPASTDAASTDAPIKIVPFTIKIPQAQLDDVLTRVKNVRWPVAPVSRNQHEFGAGLDMMKDLQKYWVTEYNWREQEAKLNEFPQFKATVDGRDIHFIHVKGKGKNPQPIMLIHGWPGSFIEFTRCIAQLTDPEQFGASPDDSFSVVIPSLPGFAFSSKPPHPIGGQYISRLFDRLMVEGLGYKNYIAQGGDFGAGISIGMAAESEHCKAALVNFVIGPGSKAENDEERAAQAEWDKVYIKEGAYQHIQRTKPLSLAYGMSDSPIATAAWLMEKYTTWTGIPGANPWTIYPKSQVLTIIMVYILTNSFGTSTWMYAGGGSRGGNPDPEQDLAPRRPAVEKPTVGVIHFPTELVFWPRSFAERTYNLVYWSDVAAGGHFAAFEQPLLFSREVRDFHNELERRGI